MFGRGKTNSARNTPQVCDTDDHSVAHGPRRFLIRYSAADGIIWETDT